jgi:biotin carboxyl carrier protein
MKLDIKINEKIKEVELIEKLDNKIKISVDGKVYDLDSVMVEPGVYSVLINNKSYNVELVENDGPKKLTVNTIYKSFDASIIDAEEKYKNLRKGSDLEDNNIISSPMPGTVVKILVKVGDEVSEGETVIIVSAMKMESEYKVNQKRKVKEVCVSEGDNIKSNQALIIVE